MGDANKIIFPFPLPLIQIPIIMRFLLRLLFAIILSSSMFAFSQIPNNYYNGTNNKTGYELKSALHLIIASDYTAQSYASLWNHFLVTDAKSNGKVWDIYSDLPAGLSPYEYTFITDQCGNYNQEAICYNREHSFPQSWFGGAAPMNTDLFHIYPTDGFVNGMRDNFPYGEVLEPNKTSLNGSKLGPNATIGYSGVVFEPIDEYKGDLARTYFYMATRYENVIVNWENLSTQGTVVLNGTANQVFEQWFLNLLFKWHHQDLVSQKEIDRNNAIYHIQKNRNPFIDYPNMADCIWLNQCDDQSSSGKLESYSDVVFLQNKANKGAKAIWHDLNQATVHVYDLTGRLVLAIPSQFSGEEINLKALKDGIYIIEIIFINRPKCFYKVIF